MTSWDSTPEVSASPSALLASLYGVKACQRLRGLQTQDAMLQRRPQLYDLCEKHHPYPQL